MEESAWRIIQSPASTKRSWPTRSGRGTRRRGGGPSTTTRLVPAARRTTRREPACKLGDGARALPRRPPLEPSGRDARAARAPDGARGGAVGRGGRRGGRGRRPLLRLPLGRAREEPEEPGPARPAAAGRHVRGGRARHERSAHRLGAGADAGRGRELRPRDLRRVRASALLRVAEDGIGEARPRVLRPVAEVAVGEAREGEAGLRVDPEERAAAAEVAERPRRVARARPGRLLPVAKLEAQAPLGRPPPAGTRQGADRARGGDPPG